MRRFASALAGRSVTTRAFACARTYPPTVSLLAIQAKRSMFFPDRISASKRQFDAEQSRNHGRRTRAKTSPERVIFRKPPSSATNKHIFRWLSADMMEVRRDTEGRYYLTVPMRFATNRGRTRRGRPKWPVASVGIGPSVAHRKLALPRGLQL
jgi:hypothetical protein